MAEGLTPPVARAQVRKLSGSARTLVDVNAARALKVAEPLDKLVEQGKHGCAAPTRGRAANQTSGARVTAKPRVETLVHELSERTRQIVSRRAVQVADGLDPTQYAVEGPADGAVLGEPLVVRFRAPAGHPPDDWVGLYQHRRKMCVGSALVGSACDGALTRRCVHAG